MERKDTTYFELNYIQRLRAMVQWFLPSCCRCWTLRFGRMTLKLKSLAMRLRCRRQTELREGDVCAMFRCCPASGIHLCYLP